MTSAYSAEVGHRFRRIPAGCSGDFHVTGKAPEIRKQDRPFPALPFKRDVSGKDFVADFGRHVFAERLPDRFALGQSFDHGIARIPENAYLVVHHNANPYVIVSVPDLVHVLQHVPDRVHNGPAHHAVEHAGRQEEDKPQDHREADDSAAVGLGGKHPVLHFRLQGDQGHDQNGHGNQAAEAVIHPDASRDGNAGRALHPSEMAVRKEKRNQGPAGVGFQGKKSNGRCHQADHGGPHGKDHPAPEIHHPVEIQCNEYEEGDQKPHADAHGNKQERQVDNPALGRLPGNEGGFLSGFQAPRDTPGSVS